LDRIRPCRLAEKGRQEVHAHTDDLFQLIAKFIDYDTRHLLIEKDGKYIGVLYAKDVIRVGFTERSKQLDELDDMVSLEFYENWKRKKRDR